MGRDTWYDNKFEIPTFGEIYDLVEAGYIVSVPMPGFDGGVSTYTQQKACLYIETKWPAAHKARGLDLAQALIAEFDRRKLLNEHLENGGACDPLFYIQSFEADILKELNEKTDLKLVQLVSPIDAIGTPSYELEDIATYADGVGPFKSLVMDLETGEPTGYAEQARALGLEVHPWTFRNDDLAPGFKTPEAEINAILDAGATGFFTDFPATGLAVVEARKP